jgi:O-antigen/teichoic acid export membrane protein
MIGGVLLSKVLPFLALPILYRLFDESHFGALYLFISFTTVIANFSTLKYEFSIVLERSIKNAINITAGTLMIFFGFTLLASITLFIFKEYLVEQFDLYAISMFFKYVPFVILAVGFSNIMNYWFNRSSNFKIISSSKITQTSSAEGIKLYNGYNNPTPWGLIQGYILGTIGIAVFYFIFFIKHLKRFIPLLSMRTIGYLLVKHQKFPKFNVFSDLISNLLSFAYIYLFYNLYNPSIAGNIGLSLSYAYGVFSLISIAYSQVFYSEISKIKTRELLRAFYWKNAKNLSIISIVIIVVIELVPEQLFVLFLGEKAVNLVPVLRIMIIWMSISFVSSSLSFIYAKVKAQDKMMYLDLLHLISVTSGIYLAHYFGLDYIGALIVFTIAQVIHYVLALLLVNIFIRRWNES